MPGEPATVFVVDDDAAVRRSLSRLLGASGYRAIAAASAGDFLRLVTGVTRPCCVILDVRLPDLDGLDLQQRLTEMGVLLPIVFITGHGDIPMSVKAMKAGAVDFLSKPFEPRHLLAAVRAAIERDAQQSAERGAEERVRSLVGLLTPREREVMDLVVAGLLNKQIAAQLGVAEKPVKVHRGRVMRKLKVSNVATLVGLTGKSRAAATP